MKLSCFSFVAAVLFCLLPLPVAQSQVRHPFLGGRWELDPNNSTLGNMPKLEKYVEIIDHDEPRIIITTEEKAPGLPPRRVSVQYSTDQREVSTEIDGQVFKSKSKWAGEKLITLITPPKGDQMIEMRYLSKDKKFQAVDLYFRDAGGGKKPDQERIMIYRGQK